MGDQLQNALAAVLEKMLQSLDTIGAELPIIITQLLEFATLGELAQLGGYLVTSCILVYVTYLAWVMVQKDKDWLPMLMIAGCGWIVQVIFIVKPIVALIKLQVAPKVWLLEYLQQML